MENNEFYCLGDLPVSALMRSATEQDDDEIMEHSGIKGMKWGVRRYQNKDGSLTPAGKKRYGQELAKVREAEKTLKTKQATKAKIDSLNERKKAVEDGEAELKSVPARSKSTSKNATNTSTEAESKKKTSKDMTDDELRAAVNRMQLEKQFNTLQSELNPKKTSAGKEFVNKLGKSLGDATAEAVKTAGKSFMEKKLKEVLGVDDKKTKSKYDLLKEEVDRLNLEKQYKDLKSDKSLRDEFNQLTLEKNVTKLRREKKNNWE